MHWLRLIRLPTVFTAMADIFLGFLVVSTGEFKPIASFGLLLAASSCLYFAGMVFNDVFDLKKDTEEQPNRPLPSGAISLRAASVFGGVLCVVGLVLAFLVSVPSGVIAIAIVAAVFAYDWLLKTTNAAPIAMGSCRVLNVLLGASVVGEFETLFVSPQLIAAIGLGVYIAGLTWFARREAVGGNKRDLVGGSVTMIAALIGLTAFAVNRTTGSAAQIGLLLGFITMNLSARMVLAIQDPVPPKIIAGIRTSLLSLVFINASLVLALTGSTVGAVATAALIVPATIVRKWIPLT